TESCTQPLHISLLASLFVTAMSSVPSIFSFFFFNDPATTEIYTLSLHDALRSHRKRGAHGRAAHGAFERIESEAFLHQRGARKRDRKSTRLNSSHRTISYAVFCLKKKKKKRPKQLQRNRSTIK